MKTLKTVVASAGGSMQSGGEGRVKIDAANSGDATPSERIILRRHRSLQTKLITLRGRADLEVGHRVPWKRTRNILPDQSRYLIDLFQS